MPDFTPQDFLARIEAAVPKAVAAADAGDSTPVAAARDFYLKAVAEFESAIAGTKDTIAKLQADIDENAKVLAQYEHLRDAVKAAADLLTGRLNAPFIPADTAAPQPVPPAPFPVTAVQPTEAGARVPSAMTGYALPTAAVVEPSPQPVPPAA